MEGQRLDAQGTLDLFQDTLRIEARSEWPESLRGGWVPVRVRVENSGDRLRAFELELSAQTWHTAEAEVRHAVRIDAGEVEEFELLVPALEGSGRVFGLSVQFPGVQTYTGSVVVLGPDLPDLRGALLLRRDAVAEGSEIAWRDELSGGTVSDGSNTYPRTSFAVVPWDRASARPQAYTSLDLVLIDTAAGLPPQEVLSALRAWTLQGGQLGFVGPDARARAETAGFGAYLERRFAFPAAGAGLESWSVGLGRIHLAESAAPREGASLPPFGAWRALLHDDSTRPGLARLREVSAADRGRWLLIPGLQNLPYRGFLLLLLVFATLIGPVNFYLVLKVWRRPPLLLVTIPAVAVSAAGVVLAYGVFSQGIHVREAVQSLSLLDQRERVAATLERRTFFVGLGAGRGLEPAANTSVFGVPDPSLSDEMRFVVQSGVSDLLATDYLPARREVHVAVATQRAARGRLLFEPAGDSFEVQNGLEARVELLLLRDATGGWHVAAEGVEVEAAARLAARSEEEAAEALAPWFDEALPRQRSPWFFQPYLPLALTSSAFDPARASLEQLWPSSYLAVVASNPLRDELGLEARSERQIHIVLGLLPERQEDWE